jgi:hypothetical protein
MRPAEGKGALIVNDHVGNVITHGLPEAEPVWTLAGVQKRDTAWCAPVWTCPECSALNPLSTRTCTACGYQKPAPPPRILPPPQAGVLAEVTAERLARARSLTYRQMLHSRLTEAELRAFAQANGYKPGWVHHRLREQAAGPAGGDPW